MTAVCIFCTFVVFCIQFRIDFKVLKITIYNFKNCIFIHYVFTSSKRITSRLMTYPCRLYHCHGIQICTCNRNYQFCLCNLHVHHMVLDSSSIRLHLNEKESVHLWFVNVFEKATETKAFAT